jgi:hypothetical protein
LLHRWPRFGPSCQTSPTSGFYRYDFILLIVDSGATWLGWFRADNVPASACPSDVAGASWIKIAVKAAIDPGSGEPPPVVDSPISISAVTGGADCPAPIAPCVDCGALTGTCDDSDHGGSLDVDLTDLLDCWLFPCNDERPGVETPAVISMIEDLRDCAVDGVHYVGDNGSSITAEVTHDQTPGDTGPHYLRIKCDGTLVWEGCLVDSVIGVYARSCASTCTAPATLTVIETPP